MLLYIQHYARVVGINKLHKVFSMVSGLSIYNRLVAVGVSESVAKEHAQIMDEMVEQKLATKQDLRDLESGMNRRFKRIEERMEESLEKVELRMLVRHGAMTFALGGLLVAVKFFG